MFDPEKFLHHKVTSPSSTSFIPVPVGDYIAKIPLGGVAQPRVVPGDKGTSVIVDVTWEISPDDPRFKEVCEETGQKNPRLKQGLFLDCLFDDKGEVIGLDDDEKKNVQLGLLRDALGQNKKGKDWSFKHLEGSIARINVVHNSSKGDMYANIAKKNGVVKL